MCGGSTQKSSTSQTSSYQNTQTNLEDHSVTDIYEDHSDNSSLEITDDHSDNSVVEIDSSLTDSTYLQGGSTQHIENIGFSDDTTEAILEFTGDALEKGFDYGKSNFDKAIAANSEALGQAFNSTVGGLQDTNNKLLAGVAVAGLIAAAIMTRK
ncbi:hypothetical protein [Emcibacter nanhaiensis]|uniref:Uncharacterized protein n=1 Tax=Emcibacter nanhaiensis TaxID=1505037 RepID=A0A501PTB1_9PROT|nr:hypothetical protein [Emcibacter nanhaiensis]TPD62996.1 hypothetical protein FIV46_02645 [Emcibacter nanhaiensis]